jgi:hypothetical protein
VAQDIELSTVEGLVYFGRADDGLVNLHAGDQVDLARLLALLGAGISAYNNHRTMGEQCSKSFHLQS